MEKRPSVFPTQQQRVDATQQNEELNILAYEQAKLNETQGIYTNSSVIPNQNEAPNGYNPNAHASAVEQMRQRTEYQLSLRNKNGDFNGIVKHSELAEQPAPRIIDDSMQKRSEEQMKLRDEQLKKNQENINKYQYKANQASTRTNQEAPKIYPDVNMNQNTQPNYNTGNYVPQSTPAKPTMNYNQDFGKNPSTIDPYIFELSQPNYNAPFDVIPLPSEGKLYRSKKPSIRIAYMTTADENILTSPNLLQSGEFLEILINRKILEPEIRYKNLTIGDRNAIMLWLRATAYGEMYPVTLLDEIGEPFDTEINLNELKTKKLGAEPDADGLFSFTLPNSGIQIRFKLLTCGDLDEIERMVEADKANNNPVNNTSIYTLERTIVEVNGERNKSIIKDFVNSIRIGDTKKLNEYIETIECGIDLNISVGTPGGGSITTFLPLNINFFWPNVKL